MLITIALPIFLATLQIVFTCPGIPFGYLKVKNCLKKSAFQCILILTFPLVPVYLSAAEQLLKNRLEKLVKSHDEEKYSGYKNLKNIYKEILFHIQKYSKLELAIEITFQIAGQAILLAHSQSETRTVEGFEGMVNKDMASQ